MSHVTTASQEYDDNERTPLVVLRALQQPMLPPLPPVSDRTFWTHDKQSGRYWGFNGDWVEKRAPRAHTHARISTVRQLKETLRGGDYAWPGGYPLYLVTSDGGTLHLKCAREMARWVIEGVRDQDNCGWNVVACEINDEDNTLCCDHCNERIEASYEPDEDDVTDEDDDS